MEHFTSIKEIDTRLKILRLQREINREILIGKRKQLQDYFTIPLTGRLYGESLKKTLIFAAATFVLRRLRAFVKKKELIA